MGTMHFARGFHPRVFHATLEVIQTFATDGIVPVSEELLIAPETLLAFHEWKMERVLLSFLL